jgi:hypothetical protein
MQRLDVVNEYIPAVRRALRILLDTKTSLEDGIQRSIFMIARTVDARAQSEKGDELLAKYKETREYRSATGRKAARTRQRNQEQAEAEQAEQAEAEQAEAEQAKAEQGQGAPATEQGQGGQTTES